MFQSSAPVIAQAKMNWAASLRVSGLRWERYPNCFMTVEGHLVTLTALPNLKVQFECVHCMFMYCVSTDQSVKVIFPLGLKVCFLLLPLPWEEVMWQPASTCLSVCLSLMKLTRNIIRRWQISGSVKNGSQNRSLYFGDISDSGGTLNFNLSEIKIQQALFRRKSTVLCKFEFETAYIYWYVGIYYTKGVWHNMLGNELLGRDLCSKCFTYYYN